MKTEQFNNIDDLFIELRNHIDDIVRTLHDLCGDETKNISSGYESPFSWPVRQLLNNAKFKLKDHFRDLLQISNELQDLETNYRMNGELDK